MGKKYSFHGMPIEVRDFVPEDTVFIMKPGKAYLVRNKTTGSESIQTINQPQIYAVKPTPQQQEGGNK